MNWRPPNPVGGGQYRNAVASGQVAYLYGPTRRYRVAVLTVPNRDSPEGCLESSGVAAAHHQWLGYLTNVNAVGLIEPTLDSLQVKLPSQRLALNFYSMYQADRDHFVPRYLALLKNGFDAPPEALLKRHLNFDQNNPRLFSNALSLIRNKVDLLEGLIRSRVSSIKQILITTPTGVELDITESPHGTFAM